MTAENSDTSTDLASRLPWSSRVWRLWNPLWVNRNKRGRHFFAGFVTLLTLVLLSPYLIANRLAADGEHASTPTAAVIESRQSLTESQQDDRTMWDPKSLFVDSAGRFVDYQVPFIGWTILIYYTIFAYYLLGPFSAPRNDRGRLELLLMTQALIATCWVAFVIFIICPAEIDLRWQVEESDVFSSWAGVFYSQFYWLDRPLTSSPSLHVAQSFIIAVGVARRWRAKGRRFAVVGLWLAWIALAISIITTKQHFIWDLITGTALGIISWRLILAPAFRAIDSLSDEQLPLIAPFVGSGTVSSAQDALSS